MYLMVLVLLCTLTACTAAPLKERAIIRALFFEKAKDNYMVTLLLQDITAADKANPYQVVFGQGENFKKAWYDAENAAEGTPFYGLMDLAALPKGATWEQATAIGELLYQKARPMPEISIFAAEEALGQTTKKAYGSQYEQMKSCETENKLHWGLETLFAQKGEALLPVLTKSGYTMLLLKQQQETIRAEAPLEAQLLAILGGGAKRLQVEFMQGQAAVQATAAVYHSREALILQLTKVQWQPLSGAPILAEECKAALTKELQAAYARQSGTHTALGADPFHIKPFAQSYGIAETKAPLLQIYFDGDGDGTG